MSSIVVIGSQWGDEGKGKIVDFLAQRADVVVRYSGGSNAGHTVVVNDVAYKLRLLPSGILYKDKTCILGNGVVINPRVVLEEIRGMQAKGVDTTNLLISDRAHVVFPYHEKQDELQELALGANKIGTTKGGIGPCYMDKYARTGIRVCDLMNKEVLAEKLKRTLSAKNKLFTEYYKAEPLAYEPMLKAYLEYAEALRPHVCDTSVALGDFFDEGRKVLFEGAQATFLDIDYGTFPYVTSSNPTAGNAATGSGVGPRFIDHVVGVVKAYTTRVGEGPFVCELFDTDGPGTYLRETGHEFGTVTGRPRRCGWFDGAALRRAVEWNGLSGLAVMKLDVLDGFETVRLGVGYEYKGERIDIMPVGAEEVAQCKVIYEDFPGWKEPTFGITKWEDLPVNAQKYLTRLSEVAGCPIAVVSTGPDRAQTILLHNPFE